MRILLFCIIVLGLAPAIAQAAYKSEIDELLTVRSVAILPVMDNLQGIYSRPIETHLVENLENNHRFEYVQANFSGPILTPEELEENIDRAQEVSRGLNADAYISTRITRGPRGINARMGLFLTRDSKLLAAEDLQDYKRQDVKSLKKEMDVLMSKLLGSLPYSGVIMSRNGTRVTVNIGRSDGITKDQVITVIQIIKAKRHPKFNFLVSTEKEIIGKVKLLKIEETLSFGRIVTERDSGAITVNAKVGRLESVVYGNNQSLSDVNSTDEALRGKEGKMNFGDNPKSWVPMRNPTFGMVGARLGLGTYSHKQNNLTADAPFYPFIVIDGEIWLTPTWTMHAEIRQGIITTDNPQSGGSPSDLSHRVSSYEFLMGYNLRLGAAHNSPKVELLGGFSTYDLYVDTSTPAGLTSKTYNGAKFGVAGQYGIAPGSPYSIGANLHFFFDADMTEDPKTNGSSDNDITQFGLFLDKQIRLNLKIRYKLDFEMYNSDFAGSASSSQKHTTASGGIYYLF